MDRAMGTKQNTKRENVQNSEHCNSEHCSALCSVDCFHILDHASTSFQLKIKEPFHIQREQISLNQPLNYIM